MYDNHLIIYVPTYIVLHPVIAESPKSVITPLSTTATFKCVGQGYGYVRVTWEKRNTDILLPNKTKIDTIYTADHHIISILTIPTVEVEDEGIYQCVYMNSKATTYSYFARLNIGSKLQHT